MTSTRNNIFKKVNTEMKLIIKKYSIFQVKMKAMEYFRGKEEANTSEQCKTYKNYISYIDLILDTMRPEESEIIKKIYIQKVSLNDLGYSQTCVYRHLTSAIQSFLELFDRNICQQYM